VTTVIWRFSDGNPGHDSQSVGLVDALSRRVPVQRYEPAAVPARRAAAWWLSRRYPPGDSLPAPDLLVGAGHATHLPMLAARRRHGGRSVVLMKPSLPYRCFDLCLVPRHDTTTAGDNLLLTEGALNSMVRSDRHDPDKGLVIIGGPSRHVRWDDEILLHGVEELLQRRPPTRWWLTTSRRTPAALLDRLRRRVPRAQATAFGHSPPGWLQARLAEAGEVWVSRDSVSMIYEALTCGARVGLLDVPVVAGADRVNAGIDRLVATGWVTAPAASELAAGPPQPLDEAARCADWIVSEWLKEN
jgi:mitochondrial fission protein ELM1